jgi:hypothetical protein
MSRLRLLTTTTLALASLAPGVALAAGAGSTELRGAPQLVQLDSDTVQVRFVNDDRASKGRVAIAGHGTATRITAAGRHGDDFKYVATVRLRKAMTVGEKYEVRIAVNGDETPAKRLAVLKAAK